MKDKFFTFFFTVVYFLIFCFFIDLIFRNTLNIFSDLLAIICWVIAFIISVALAEYTVKKKKNGVILRDKTNIAGSST